MSLELILNSLSSIFLMYAFTLTDKKSLVITGLIGKVFGIGYWLTVGDALVASMMLLIAFRNLCAINFHLPKIKSGYFLFYFMIIPLVYFNYSGPKTWIVLLCYLLGTFAYVKPLKEMRIFLTMAGAIWLIYEMHYGMLPSKIIISLIVSANLYKIFHPEYGVPDKIKDALVSRLPFRRAKI
jgi:hypothetical protein